MNAIRSYHEIITRLHTLPRADWKVEWIGEVVCLPVFAVRRSVDADAPSVLLTGGMHGDEPAHVEAFWRWLVRLVRCPAGGFALDRDATVFCREGKQEGVLKGFNPWRKGHGSHHPLLACWLRRTSSCTAGCAAGTRARRAASASGWTRAYRRCSNWNPKQCDERNVPREAVGPIHRRIPGLSISFRRCPRGLFRRWR